MGLSRPAIIRGYTPVSGGGGRRLTRGGRPRMMAAEMVNECQQSALRNKLTCRGAEGAVTKAPLKVVAGTVCAATIERTVVLTGEIQAMALVDVVRKVTGVLERRRMAPGNAGRRTKRRRSVKEGEEAPNPHLKGIHLKVVAPRAG